MAAKATGYPGLPREPANAAAEVTRVSPAIAAQRPAAGVGTIEALVAITVFSFVLIAIIGLLMSATTAGATAESFSIASNLARQRLGQVADDVARRGTSSSYPPSAVVGGRTYTFTTTETNVGGNLVNVQVRVDYQIAFGSACAGSASGTVDCPGNVRTFSRILQTRVRRP